MSAVPKSLPRRELLIGAGASRAKRIRFEEIPPEFENVTTLDILGDADIIHDLDVLPYPFADNTFDEIHAYEVLEHCGAQGDWRFFFAQFSEFWRILKPDGYFIATVPMWDSPWAWGDPGHRRVITADSISFLYQSHYEQVGRTNCADYRSVYTADFKPIGKHETDHQLGFVIQAIKRRGT